MIKYNELYFRYRKKNPQILIGITFNINQGDVHGVLGHNGAGKTTLLRLTSGIIYPTKGEILIDNKVPEQFKRYMAYMPESNGIYDKLTALQNLKFRASLSNTNKKEINQKSEEFLVLLGLIDRRNDLVGIWSNGMKKRLALACALVGSPKLLLLDEPTNGIDPESLEVLISIIKHTQRLGATMMISSHNLDFINEIGNSISIIEKGTLVYNDQIDTNKCKVKDIYFNQLNKFRKDNKDERNNSNCV